MFQRFHQGGTGEPVVSDEEPTGEVAAEAGEVVTGEVPGEEEVVTGEVPGEEEVVTGEVPGEEEVVTGEEEEVTGEDEGQQGQSPGFMSTVLKAFTGTKESEGTQKPEEEQKPEGTIMNGGKGKTPTNEYSHTHGRFSTYQDQIYLAFTDDDNAILPNEDTAANFKYEFSTDKKETIINIIKNNKKYIYQLIKIYENLIIKIKKIEHDINYDSQIRNDNEKKKT
jgi:hypothetical protein